jgi:acyl phosphate:glycerol-3-phosphate acyltransferase
LTLPDRRYVYVLEERKKKLDVRTVLQTIGMAAAAYFIGAISFGYVIVRIAKGVDIRKYGSGSTGTTNVLRTAGLPAAALTVAGDFLKGVFVVVVARLLKLPDISIVLAGFAVVAGHNWPVFLRFKGGRGVATGFGVSLGLTWQISTALFLFWGVLIAATGYVSMASVIIMVLYPLMVIYFHEAWPIIVFAVVGSGMVIFTHRQNIVRLFKGEESKIGQKVKVER